ncbi:ferric reductase-like transmembrane domain-containing protein [Propioniciclava soli]|uniref:ferredoxin reductase family protein n=1 Tax=Propioniciclava soli TaxID=2775081 RepID=UPI001E35D0B4|nr:ferredoxin reductase family protein [Propioniciclava soli]
MTRLSMWHAQDTIEGRKISRAKGVLIALIAVTSLLPLVFVSPDDAPLLVNVYKYVAKTGAFVGSMLLIWQFILGFRGALSSFFPDLTWIVELHKTLGQWGVPIILLHPVFIGLYYLETRGQNIYALDLGDSFSQLVLLGMVTLAVIAFVVVTSVWFRGRLGFYPWLYTHMSAYVVPPFLFIHSFLLGPTIQGTFLQYYWWFFTAVIAALFVYRILHKLGLFSARYRVATTRTVADSTTEITMDAVHRRIVPAPGQFIYLRHNLAENSHPYTVSTYDEERKRLGITAKQEGDQTAALQKAQEGDLFIIDGPYGVFTRPAREAALPLVVIAGGIGITPFRRLWQDAERRQNREVHVFYANETFDEISYRDELDALEHVQVVHVLNDEPDFDGETGLVDVDVLERNLPRDITDYQYLLCGPPPMITSLEEELLEAGVPDDQVSHELFAT